MKDRRTREERRQDAYAQQALEGNPLTDEEKALSERWEREGLTTDQRIALIVDLVKSNSVKK